MHKTQCELDKPIKTMVDKRTFKKLSLQTHVGSWNWCPRKRNARLEVFFSGNTEWRKWSGDWILLKKNPAQHYQKVQILLKY